MKRKFPILLILILAGLLMASSLAPAPYQVSWHTADNGGDCSSGGHFSVCGTAGQPDAEGAGGGDFQLAGGFWSGPSLSDYPLYLPTVRK